MNLEQISHFIQSRRSHFLKEFNGQIAPDNLIENLIENAQWAPNHKLTLPWEFIVFKNSDLEELGNLIIQISGSSLNQEKMVKIKSWPQKISHLIAVCIKPSSKTPEWEEIAAMGAAIQNMYLTIHATDQFGGYWTTGNATNHPKMKEYLHLDDHSNHLGFFVIGGINEKRREAHRQISPIVYYKS